jgi:hypothetical protein
MEQEPLVLLKLPRLVGDVVFRHVTPAPDVCLVSFIKDIQSPSNNRGKAAGCCSYFFLNRWSVLNACHVFSVGQVI